MCGEEHFGYVFSSRNQQWTRVSQKCTSYASCLRRGSLVTSALVASSILHMLHIPDLEASEMK